MDPITIPQGDTLPPRIGVTDTEAREIANGIWWSNFHKVAGIFGGIMLFFIPVLVWGMSSQGQLKDQRIDFILIKLSSIADQLTELSKLPAELAEVKTRLSYVEAGVKKNSSQIKREALIHNSTIGAE